MSVWLPGKAAVHASQSKGSPTGSGGCASTVQLVKPGDPEGTEGGWWWWVGGGVTGVESQSSREQREPWLWIKALASLSSPGLTLADTAAHYGHEDDGKHVRSRSSTANIP